MGFNIKMRTAREKWSKDPEFYRWHDVTKKLEAGSKDDPSFYENEMDTLRIVVVKEQNLDRPLVPSGIARVGGYLYDSADVINTMDGLVPKKYYVDEFVAEPFRILAWKFVDDVPESVHKFDEEIIDREFEGWLDEESGDLNED